MARYPVKPPTPVFRNSAPGAANCKICFPIAHCERGRGTIRNIGNSRSIRTGTLYDTNVGWSKDWTGPCLEVTNTASDGVRVGLLSDCLENPGESTFVLLWTLVSGSATNEMFFSDNYWKTWVRFRTYNSQLPQFIYGANTDYANAAPTFTYSPYQQYMNVFTAGSRGVEFWQDGILLATDTTGYDDPDTAGTYYQHLFGFNEGSSALSKISYFARYDRQLSIPAIMDIFSDPWGMIRPAKTIIVPGVGTDGIGTSFYASTVPGAAETNMPVFMRQYRNRRVS